MAGKNKPELWDEGDPADLLMVGNPEITLIEGQPAVLWWREAANRKGELVYRSAGGGRRLLDSGALLEQSLASCPDGKTAASAGRSGDGRVLALWCKAGERGELRVWCSGVGGDPPHALSGSGASAPRAAFGTNGQVLVIWARIAKDGATQRIEAVFDLAQSTGTGAITRSGQDGGPEPDNGLGPEGSFLLSETGWASRPWVISLDDSMSSTGFFVCWDELSPAGGSVKAVFISDDGRVLRTLNIFPAERPGCRYLFPTCTIAAGSVLVSAVKVEDVTGDHGVIDQYHTIATALVSSSDGEVRVTGYPARLDHGLLVDIERGIPAKGYLGLRRQPRLLRGGFLYWERREAPDTAAPVTAGVLCCSEFRSQTGDWGPERVLYRGGLSYRAARDGDGGLWIAFREIEQGHGHRLRVDHLDPEAEPSAPGQTVSWAEPRHWQPADLPVRMASVRPRRTVESRTAGSRTAGRSTPHSQATGETTEFLYWGDPHVHSALSIDVEGEPDEMLHYARDLAKLDFVALVENDDLFTCRLTAAERFRGDELAEAWTKNGLFVVLSGFEYTWQVAYGLDRNHRTVLLPARGGRMIRWSDPRQDGGEGRAGDYGTPSGLKLLAERLDALLITQHQKWELADTDREVGIEAVSGWYTYMHNPFYAHAAWASGRRLGLYGTSDGHRRVAGLAGGLTGVWAEELSPAGIMSSMRKHRTFATQGRRPEIRLELSDERGTSLFLGDYGKLTGAITARILVRTEGADDTEAYDDRLVLVELKHGDRVLSNWEASDFTDNGRSCIVEQRLPPLYPESHLYQTDLLKPYYVYLRVRLAGPDREYTYNAAAARGPWAWSSPIWWEWEE